MTSTRWISRRLKEELTNKLDPQEISAIIDRVVKRKEHLPKMPKTVRTRIERFAANQLPCVVTHVRKWRIYTLEGFKVAQDNAQEMRKHKTTQN